MKLTEKEIEAFKAITMNALEGMGGKEPKDLLNDNFSWFNRLDISKRTGGSKENTAGLMSSLGEKGLVYEADAPEWAMTDEGIKFAQDLFGRLR